MFPDHASLERDASDSLLPEAIRLMAKNLLVQGDAYSRIRMSEARKPTDPAGHSLVRPSKPSSEG